MADFGSFPAHDEQDMTPKIQETTKIVKVPQLELTVHDAFIWLTARRYENPTTKHFFALAKYYFGLKENECPKEEIFIPRYWGMYYEAFDLVDNSLGQMIEPGQRVQATLYALDQAARRYAYGHPPMPAMFETFRHASSTHASIREAFWKKVGISPIAVSDHRDPNRGRELGRNKGHSGPIKGFGDKKVELCTWMGFSHEFSVHYTADPL